MSFFNAYWAIFENTSKLCRLTIITFNFDHYPKRRYTWSQLKIHQKSEILGRKYNVCCYFLVFSPGELKYQFLNFYGCPVEMSQIE